MASGDVHVQTTVHSLDQGKLAFLIRIGMILALVIATSLLYLFVQFRGFSLPSAMDQAQIARNLANGQGFTTLFIRPAALGMLANKNSSPDPVDLEKFPDFYQSPLNPWVNSLALRFFKGDLKMTPTDLVYFGERIITSLSVLMFLASVVIWYFVIVRLFDTRLALLSSIAILVTDMMWQFSLSGLPQMLALLLFSGACLVTLFAMDTQEEEQLVLTLVWIAVGGFLFGLMTLTHGLCFWIFLGWLAFVGIYYRPRLLTLLAALAAFTVVVAPWLVRNYQVCGNPFGMAIFGAFFESAPEAWQQSSFINFRGSGISLPGKIRINLMLQLENLFGLVGLNMAAGSFFLALFHPFRNRKTFMFKWAILGMWISALVGMSLYRGGETISENQIHVLFIPLFAAYGLAFLLVLWGRLELDKLWRTVFIVVVLFACSIPMLFTLFANERSRIQWPPYVPPFIAILGDWFDSNEVICSDMPWAVAWYSQRLSLLLPDSSKTFNRMHDYAETKQPINGLYLTPLTGNTRLFSDIYKGRFKDWAPLILRPPKLDGFPFMAYTPLPIDGECIIFADRDRWSQPRKSP